MTDVGEDTEVTTIEELKRLDSEIEKGMLFLESVYEEYKYENGPSWEEIKPRIEKHLIYLFNVNRGERTCET